MNTDDLTTQGALIKQARSALLDALSDFFRDFGFSTPEAIDGLRRGAGDSFDELTGIKDKRGFEQARGLTASRISLVHEEDLEFSIRLSDFSRRLRERCEGQLAKLHLRFMTLLEQTDAAAEQLPIGPETVCCGIRGLSDGAGMTGDERIELLDRIEAGLGHRLVTLYTRQAGMLEDAGIQPQTLGRPEPLGGPRHTAQPAGGLGSVAAPAPVVTGALAELQQALLTRQAAAQRSAVTVDPQLSSMILERVLAWLTEQQSSAGGAAQRLGVSDVGPLIAPESKANIDAVERIFDAIIASPRLPVAAKGATARLRIPLLKLAMLNPALLTDPADPARRLIDAIGSACVGLAADASPNHPVCWAISETAARIQQNFDRDAQIFAAELPKLESIVAVRLTAVKDRAAGFIPHAARLEREEIALRFASKAIRALESGDPAAPVRAFLENHWVRTLQNTLILRGEKSSEWRNQLTVADRLIWSAQPKATAEERSQLLKLLPELLRRMHAGLAEIGLEETARNEALAPCMDVHTALMYGREVSDPSLTPYPGPAVELRLDPVPEASGLRVLRVCGFLVREPAVPEAIMRLRSGDWLDLALPDGRRVRGRIGWTGQSRQILLLVDPDRQGVLAISQRALVQQWEAGLARVLPEISLFEQAAEYVLKSLKTG
jgi:hypothetical protein